MKATGYILSGIGFIGMVSGGCMCCEDVWAVPAVVFVVGVCVMALGMSILQHKQNKAAKALEKTTRHSKDADKLKLSDDMAALHQEIIINEIWQ